MTDARIEQGDISRDEQSLSVYDRSRIKRTTTIAFLLKASTLKVELRVSKLSNYSSRRKRGVGKIEYGGHVKYFQDTSSPLFAIFQPTIAHCLAQERFLGRLDELKGYNSDDRSPRRYPYADQSNLL